MSHWFRGLLLPLGVAAAMFVGGAVACKPDTQSGSGVSDANGVVSADESRMSPALRQIRDEVLRIKSKEQLAELLVRMEGSYDSYPADAKYFAAQFLLLEPWRGIVWRMIPLYDKTRVTHSIMLVFATQLLSAANVFLPGDHIAAIEDYLTVPFDTPNRPRFGELKPQFPMAQAMQDFVVRDVFPAVERATSRIQAIQISPEAPLVWDNRFVTGGNGYQDNLDRFTYVGEAERNALLAGLHLGQHHLRVLCAYDINQFAQVREALGRIVGMDGFSGSIDGMPAARRVAEINRFPAAFRMRPDVGPAHMKAALEHLRASVGFARKSWDIAQKWPESDFFPLNPARLRPWSRPTNETLGALERLVKGPAAMRSRATGETVTVDLPRFYMDPPADLKAFMPVRFRSDRGGQVYNTPQYQNLRDYRWGQPTAWNLTAWQKYVPSLKDPGEVRNAVRVLSQSWGGWLPNNAMAVFAM